MGNQQHVVRFQEAARLHLSEQLTFFSRCIFFEVPHSGYPSALVSALALASPPTRGRSRGSGHRSLG